MPAFNVTTAPPALSIMSDPRICRGSIAARMREEAAQRAAEEKRQREEYRFRTKQIRNRLEMMIAPGAVQAPPIASQRQILALGSIECPRARNKRLENDSTVNAHSFAERNRSVARLAGPLRRRYQPSFGLAYRSSQNGSPGAYQLPTIINETVISRSLMTSSKPEEAQINQSSDGFKNVRFLPFHEQNPHQRVSLALSNVMRSKSSAPRGFIKRLSSGFSSTSFQRRIWSDIPALEDPPPSASGPPTFVEIGVQTEEEKAFENTFAPLISSMVSDAISNAMRSLLEENELKMISEREHKLIQTICRQNEKNSELNRVVEQQIELQKELETQRATAVRQLRAFEARRLAVDAVENVTGKSVGELISRNMIQAGNGQRSVSADTQHLERSIARTKQTAAELQSDFIPYVYARAERIFVERLAGTYLKDALFARDEKRRDDAQSLLNAQIFKYNQLIAASEKR